MSKAFYESMDGDASRSIIGREGKSICVCVYMYNPVKRFLSSSMREVVQCTQQIAGLSLQEGYQIEDQVLVYAVN